MSSLNLLIPHQLPKEEALNRIKQLFVKLKTEHSDQISNVKEEWQNDVGKFQFTTYGFGFTGIIKVNDDNVTIDGNLPFALSFFKGKISSAIEEKATDLLKEKSP
jgi:hypothetical protein